MKSSNSLSISALGPGDEDAVAQLVMRVFMAHVGHEYTDEGVAEFAKYADAKAIRERVDGGISTVLLGGVGDVLTGMLEFRGTDHLALMFVDDGYQRRGIASALFHAMTETHGQPRNITVNSSRSAIPVYQRLGFVIAGEENTVNGITFTPMRRSVD